ncbi:MAG: hypothetical protein HKN24_13040 [Acidimicrobiales bacterium]|nr:hypothetical protein [Acidimicrobiales bacterium]
MNEITEIRDYHFAGDLGAYQTWWQDALPVIGAHMEIIGVWVDSGEPPRISGSSPMELPLGSANVTWMIRWPDMEAREQGWAALGEDPAWIECADRHPGFDDYLHMSVRFCTPVMAVS